MYETKLREHGLRSAQVLLTHADLADRERYLNARSTLLTLLGAEGHPGDQRERHRGQRRDQVRRQRHARCAGGQPGRGRCAGDPDRPARPVLGRPAQGPAGALHRRGRGRRPGTGAHGRRRRLCHRPRRHDHQGAGRQARGRQRRQHRDRLGPRARRAAAPGGRRAHRQRAGGRAPPSWRRASSGWSTTCSCAARWWSTTARCASCATKARACCRSAWSRCRATSSAAT